MGLVCSNKLIANYKSVRSQSYIHLHVQCIIQWAFCARLLTAAYHNLQMDEVSKRTFVLDNNKTRPISSIVFRTLFARGDFNDQCRGCFDPVRLISNARRVESTIQRLVTNDRLTVFPTSLTFVMGVFTVTRDCAGLDVHYYLLLLSI